MVGRCWASCLTRNLRWVLFLLGSPTSPSGIEINHHRRLCVGLWNPILICVVFSSSFAHLWLGGVGLRASPATYVGSCFWLGSPTSPSGIGFNHHRWLCVGLWNPILICVVFSSSFAYSGWEVLGFVPHPQPTLGLVFIGKYNKPIGR